MGVSFGSSRSYMDIRLYQMSCGFPANVNGTTQSNILPSLHAHSFLVFCKETFVWKGHVIQEILIV